ncbi:MAG: lysylphosphatidylglycerol synthase domain-containing protein [Pyrinomonadaceae bacterium]
MIVASVILTTCGICLFSYFVYSVGLNQIREGIARVGFAGFAVVLLIHFTRICARAFAWKLCVHDSHLLSIKDTIPAVMVGEAMSSSIPLGILVSGTSKAIVVRNRIPFVAGLSSVATENLFYSLVTSIFLIAGGITLLRGFVIDESLILTINFLLAAVSILVFLGFLMVIRQWHFASFVCSWIYDKGFFRGILEKGRQYVRRFEDLIYGFYRRYPNRFLPVCLLEAGYVILGVCEGWYILSRLSDAIPSLLSAFMLEAVSRFISVSFKLIPFVIGVDEAGAQFVGETIGLAAGIGVTLAIIRKLRILFWTAVGFTLIIILAIRRGLTFRNFSKNN